MNPLHLDLPLGMLLASWVVFALSLAWAIRGTRWEQLAACNRGHVWHGCIAFVVLLWLLQATLRDGFTFHLLGMVLVFHALGLHLAITSAALAIVVVAIIQKAPFVNIAVAFSLLALPALVTGRLVLTFCEKRLPHHMFVYLFGAGFVGAALSVAVAVPLSTIAWAWLTNQPFLHTLGTYLPIAILLCFAEAVLTGMLTTIAVVYKPKWVATFEDSRYLAPPQRSS